MNVLVGWANIGTGVAYILGVGVLSFILARRCWAGGNKGLALSFYGLVMMASSCGPHHLHLARNVLDGDLRATGLDAMVILVAFPFGVAWLYWQSGTIYRRWATDWVIPGDQDWPVMLMIGLASYGGVAVSVAWGGVGQNNAEGIIQLVVLGLYCFISYLLWSGQLRRRRQEGVWSGKGLALACVFPTCGITHAVYGLAVASGRSPSDAHFLGEPVIDTWGVLAAVFFIVVATGQRRLTQHIDQGNAEQRALLWDAIDP